MSAEYPSKDELSERAARGDPVAQGARARRVETGGATATPSTRPPGRRMSATIMRLARRLQRDPDELAQEIPADTVRRTKYGVLEEKQPDGSTLFKHIPVK